MHEPYTSQIKLRSTQERGYFDQLVDAFTRPPRQIYDPSKLGTPTFMVNKLLIYREDFKVESRKEKIQLECSLFSPVHLKDKIRPCVIYLHGNSSSRLESTCYAHMLAVEGISLLCFDFGGCGISEGHYVSLGWHERTDFFAVLKAAKLKFPQLGSYGVWGRSMGAVTAIMAASEDQDLKILVLDSPYCDLKQLCIDLGDSFHVPTVGVRLAFYMIRKKIKKLVNYDPKHMKINEFIKLISPKAGVLFLRGSNDKMVRMQHVEQLYNTFKGEKYMTIFPGDHNAGRPIEVYENIVKFFTNRFPKEQVKIVEKIKQPIEIIKQRKNSTDSEVNYNDMDEENPYMQKHDRYITEIRKPQKLKSCEESLGQFEEEILNNHDLPLFEDIHTKKS